MQQHAEEQFSALIDDEADLPPGKLLAELLDDAQARRRWSRYHLIGDVLRDRDTPLDLGLAARISAAIDTEPALLAPRPRPTPAAAAQPSAPTRRPWALAAGLAAVGFTGLMFATRTPPPPELPAVAMPTPAVPSLPGAVPVAVVAPGTATVPVQSGADEPQFVRWDDTGIPSTADPRSVEFHRRLNSYLVNFNEQRSNLGVPGVHPYVRIVGFESDDEP